MAKSNNTGCGCLGLIGFFVLVGMCSDGNSPTPPRTLYDSTPISTESSAGVVSSARDIEDFYVHGPLNVRSGPGKNYPVTRTLSRGDRIRLGPKDGNGWAQIYPSYGGNPDGYVYRASDLVRTQPPRASSTGTTRRSSSAGSTRRSSAASRGYYLGPRGGCYTYSASGRKRYVDRSLCH